MSSFEFWDVGEEAPAMLSTPVDDFPAFLAADWLPSLPASVSASFEVDPRSWTGGGRALKRARPGARAIEWGDVLVLP